MEAISSKKQIHNLDDFFSYASAVLLKNEEFKSVEFIGKDYTYKVKIDGDNWDGTVDQRHAQYIIALQETLDEILVNCEDGNIQGQSKILVKLEIHEGCSELKPDLTLILLTAVGKMAEWQVFISVAIGLAGAIGLLALGRVLNYRVEQARLSNDVQKLEAHEETKRQMIAPLVDYYQSNIDTLAYTERPTRVIANALGKEDEIELASDVAPVSRTELKKSLPRKSRSERMTTYADGEYSLERKDYSLGRIVYTLAQGDLQVRAYTDQLSDADAESLAMEIAKREVDEEVPFLLNVQINIHHTSKRIIDGYIVGVGAPREDKKYKTLAEIVGQET